MHLLKQCVVFLSGAETLKGNNAAGILSANLIALKENVKANKIILCVTMNFAECLYYNTVVFPLRAVHGKLFSG